MPRKQPTKTTPGVFRNTKGSEPQQLRQAYQAAAEGIIIMDQQGQIGMTNPSCRRMFGYREKELLFSNSVAS